jgi:hypothetical protein
MATSDATTPPAAPERPPVKRQPPPAKHQPSFLEQMFDLIGEIPAGLAKVTGGIVPAHATAQVLHATVLPAATGAIGVANKARNAYDKGVKWWDDLTGKKDPPKKGLFDQAVWWGHWAYEKASDFLDKRGMAQEAREKVEKYWRPVKQFLKLHFPWTKTIYRDWVPAVRRFARAPVRWTKDFLKAHSPATWRVGKAIAGSVSGALDHVSHLFDKWIGPFLVGNDVKDLWDDVSERKGWKTFGTDLARTGWDWYSTAKAWGATKPFRWLGTAARFVGGEILLPVAEGVGAFLGGDALLGAAAIAAIAAAAYGTYYAIKHPKETKEFAYNVLTDLFGDAKLKAQSGWHPIADATALGLRAAKDTVTVNPLALWNDAGDLLDLAFTKRAPGQRDHPLKQDWAQLGADAVAGLVSPLPQPAKPTPGRDWLRKALPYLTVNPRHPTVTPLGPMGAESPGLFDKLQEWMGLTNPSAPAPKMQVPPALMVMAPPAGRRKPEPAPFSKLTVSRRAPPPLRKAAPPGTGWYNGLGSAWSAIAPAGPSDPQADIHSPAPLPRHTLHMHVPPPRGATHLHAPAPVRAPRPASRAAANVSDRTEAEIQVRFDNLPFRPRASSGAGASAFPFDTGAQFAL